jgi:hypothetical protein
LSDPHGQGGAGVGVDLVSGEYSFQFSYTISDVRLEHLEGTWGQLDIFSDPSFQLQFPTSPGPAQGGLMVNYLHWQLPQLGPFIVSLAAEGAFNYIAGQGWQLAEALSGDIRLAQLRWLVISGSGGLNVNFHDSGAGARVEPAGEITIGVEFEFDREQVVHAHGH